MSDAFARAATVLAADRNLGSAALYTASGEAALPVRVVLSQVEDVTGFGAGQQQTAWEAMLPIAAVPDRPVRGELLSVGDRDFKIEGALADATGSFWTLRLSKSGTWP